MVPQPQLKNHWDFFNLANNLAVEFGARKIIVKYPKIFGKIHCKMTVKLSDNREFSVTASDIGLMAILLRANYKYGRFTVPKKTTPKALNSLRA